MCVKMTFWRRHGEQPPTERRIWGRPRLGLDVAHHPPRGRGPGLGRVEGLRRLLPLQQPVQAHQLLRLPPQQRRLSFEGMRRWTILRCIKWLSLLTKPQQCFSDSVKMTIQCLSLLVFSSQTWLDLKHWVIVLTVTLMLKHLIAQKPLKRRWIRKIILLGRATTTKTTISGSEWPTWHYCWNWRTDFKMT